MKGIVAVQVVNLMHSTMIIDSLLRESYGTVKTLVNIIVNTLFSFRILNGLRLIVLFPLLTLHLRNKFRV